MHPGHVLKSHALDFWLARAAVAVSALLNLFLVNKLTPGPHWLAPMFEFALLVPLSVATARTQFKVKSAATQDHWNSIHQSRRWIRGAALVLTFFVTAVNVQALIAVMDALLHGAKGATGATLLIDALNLWFTNIVIFALWFWNLDRGGPATRGLRDHETPDLLFPQMTATGGESAAWTPGFIDYFYVSFTNATAFSPTDTMPLSARMKLLFMIEALASLATVGLIAARAVNILV